MDQTPAEAKVMRGIIAREDRKARAERREAQAAHKAATAPPPSRVGWSTKPGPVRKPSATDKALIAEAAELKDRWRRQHPAIAIAERGMRKERAELLERWDHKNDGTPETHEHAAQTRQGSLARLHLSGAISADQLAWAVEIAAVAERIMGDVTVRTASLETRIDGGMRGEGFFELLGQVRREIAYTAWRAQVSGSVAAVLDMIVGDAVGFTVVARRYRMSKCRAKKMLLDAIDLWPKVLGDACREVDAASLAAVHAGLLA